MKTIIKDSSKKNNVILKDENDNIIMVASECIIIDTVKKLELKSSSLNRTSIISEKTKSVISRLILDKAKSISKSDYWRRPEINELIKTALNLGLTNTANELIKHT